MQVNLFQKNIETRCFAVYFSHFCGLHSEFLIQLLSMRDGDVGLPKMLTLEEEHNHNYQGTMFIFM